MEASSAAPKKSLGTIRRRAVDLASFNPIRESELSPGQSLPLIIEPSTDQVDLAEWVRSQRSYIDQKRTLHGGVLFRGFGLNSAGDFEKVAAALCDNLFAEYGDLPREGVA